MRVRWISPKLSRERRSFTHRNRIPLIPSGVMLAFTVACVSASAVLAQDAPVLTPSAPMPSMDKTAQNSGAIASVNGKVLTESEFYRRCAESVGGVTDTAVGLVVLREWLQQTLAEEEATRRKLLPTSEQIERRMYALRKQWEFRGDDLEVWLAERGRTLATLREDVRHQLIAENLLTEGVTVSELEARQYYEGNKYVFGVMEQLRVSRITVDKREAATSLENSLKKGAAFADLARAKSIDPYREQGGRVPSLIMAEAETHPDLEAEVLRQVQKTRAGSWVGPIKVDNYWVFARVDERLPGRAPGYSDIQDLLIANLKVQKAGPEKLEATQKRLTEQINQAKLEVFRPEYRGLLKEINRPGN